LNNYPNGYTLSIEPGENYSVTGSVITPSKDFSGNLDVPVSISDGTQSSDPYHFLITIRPVNDPPVIVLSDTTTLFTKFGDEPIKLFEDISISDVDNDTLALAEVSFNAGQYLRNTDLLVYTNSSSSPVKGVFDAQNGILALIGKASIEQYETALDAITYQLNSEVSDSRTTTGVTVLVSDGQANSNRAGRKIQLDDHPTTPGNVEIPTAFTPNGDLVNDTWGVRPLENPELFENVIIRIYTKAGLLVFETSGLDKEWDGHFNGTMLPADVYFYTIDFRNSDPSSMLKGAVTILR
jgi:gliding motility-associated-like protein